MYKHPCNVEIIPSRETRVSGNFWNRIKGAKFSHLKCENTSPTRKKEDKSLLYNVLQCLLLTKLIILLAARETGLKLHYNRAGASQVGSVVKNLRTRRFDLWVRKIP